MVAGRIVVPDKRSLAGTGHGPEIIRSMLCGIDAMRRGIRAALPRQTDPLCRALL